MEEPTWIAGVHPVLEALETAPEGILEVRMSRATGRGVGKAIAERARQAGVKIRRSRREELDELLPGVRHQGVAARRSAADYADFGRLLASCREAARGVLVVLDEVSDPRNVGAILRTCWAFGADGLIVPRHRAAGLSAAVAKSATGAAEHVPVCRVRNTSEVLRRLKEAGFWVYGAEASGAVPLDEVRWPEHVALVLGSEHKGLRPSVAKACDVLFRIPMRVGAGSLNVGVAAGIALHRIYSRALSP